MSDEILTAENLRFQEFIQYPPIKIQENKITFITGESGCGKSTLLRLLNAAVTPSGGRILYNGQDLQELDAVQLRREVLLAGQTVFLFDKSLRENFQLFYEYRELPSPQEDTIRFFLGLCRMELPLDTLCTTMSGGEKQRVFIALCLSFLPKVLLLDEPTSALDAVNAAGLLESLQRFCKEKNITLVVVSHDAALAQRFADEIIPLERCM